MRSLLLALIAAALPLLVRSVPISRALLKAADVEVKPQPVLPHHSHHHSHTRRHRRTRVNRLREALIYLREYGYLPEGPLSTTEVREGLKAFQQLAGLMGDGNLDRETIKSMRQPRCGNRDLNDYSSNITRRAKRFAQVSKWSNKMQGGDQLKLKWYIQKYTDDIPRREVRRVVKKAFRLWSEQVGIPSMPTVRLSFQEGSSVHDSDIAIMWATGDHGDAYPFDGPGNKTNILAHTFYPNYQETGTLNGDIHFDEHEKWVLDSSTLGVHFPYVLLHEIGHALGLGHSKRQEAVMNPIYKKYSLETILLDIDDKCAINWNYVGPTNTCLFVWLMVELLPRAKANNGTLHGIGTVMRNTTASEGPNENELWNQQTLDERLNSTLERLKESKIPQCNSGNSIQLQYEVLLEQKLDFPPASAREYGPVVCNFLDGLTEMMNPGGEGESEDVGYYIQQVTVHKYSHESREEDFGAMREEAVRSKRSIRRTSQETLSHLHSAKTIFDRGYFDQTFFKNLLNIFVAANR